MDSQHCSFKAGVSGSSPDGGINLMMKRKVTDAEGMYNRVRKFVTEVPCEVLASLRVEFTKPKVIDSLLKQIRREIGMTSIEHKTTGWRYSFWYGEVEFNEFLRQIL